MLEANRGVPVTFIVNTGAPEVRAHTDVFIERDVTDGENIFVNVCADGSDGDSEEHVVEVTIRESNRKIHDGINLCGMSVLQQAGLHVVSQKFEEPKFVYNRLYRALLMKFRCKIQSS
jgi:hypothetical protein